MDLRKSFKASRRRLRSQNAIAFGLPLNEMRYHRSKHEEAVIFYWACTAVRALRKTNSEIKNF